MPILRQPFTSRQTYFDFQKSKGVYRVLNKSPVRIYSLKSLDPFPVYQACLKFTNQLITIPITGTSPVTSTEFFVRTSVDQPQIPSIPNTHPVFYIQYNLKYRGVYFIFTPNPKNKIEKSI